MNYYFLVSAILIFITGLGHTFLGEKSILGPLFQMSIPSFKNSESYFQSVLRLGWHFVTLLLFGIGSLLLYWALYEVSVDRMTVNIVAAIFFVCFFFTLLATRGRHLAWVMFLVISLLILFGNA